MGNPWRDTKDIRVTLLQAEVSRAHLVLGEPQHRGGLTPAEEEHAPGMRSAPPHPKVDQERQERPISLRPTLLETPLNILTPPRVRLAAVGLRRRLAQSPRPRAWRGPEHAGELGELLPMTSAPGGQLHRVGLALDALAGGEVPEEPDDPLGGHPLPGHHAGKVRIPAGASAFERTCVRHERPAELWMPLPHHADQDRVPKRQILIGNPWGRLSPLGQEGDPSHTLHDSWI